MPSASASIAILAYPGIEAIDIGATYGVLSMAKRLAPGLRAFVVAKSGGEVAMAGRIGARGARPRDSATVDFR